MNRVLTAAALAACVCLPARPVPAQVANGSSREKLVVAPAWLAEHLNDRDLVVLQVGRKETYDAGHIPGARLVNFDSGALAAPADRTRTSPDHALLKLPTPQALHVQLAARGISHNP